MCFGEPAGAGSAARAGRAEEAGRVREDAAVAPDNVLRSPLWRGCRWARRLPSDETGSGGADRTARFTLPEAARHTRAEPDLNQT